MLLGARLSGPEIASPGMRIGSRISLLYWFVIMGLIGLSPAALADPAQPLDVADAKSAKFEDIRNCVRANLPLTSFRQRVVLRSHDANNGERKLIADLFGETQAASGLLNLMLSVEQPADLAGARYLLNERADRDDMYVYLPAMERTRRINASVRGQPLWGTDFSYEDIKHLQSAYSDINAQYLGDASLRERPVYQLLVEPPEQAQSSYRKIEVDIDQQTCLLLEARFFDSVGISKRMHSDPARFSRLGERWLAGFVSIEDLQNKNRTSMEFSDVVYDEEISKTHFNPSSFFRVR